jgi:hypothetical protein
MIGISYMMDGRDTVTETTYTLYCIGMWVKGRVFCKVAIGKE